MNINQKIRIDHAVGKPLCLILNFTAGILGKVLRRDHTFRTGYERIVLSKFVGMGTILQMTPLMRTLRLNYPKARILFVTAESNRSLLERLALTDEIVALDDGGLFKLASSTLRSLFRLWRFKPELYLDFEIFSNFSGLVCTLSCAKTRVGFFKNSFTDRNGLYNYLIFYNTKTVVSEAFLQMARLVGCRELIHELLPLPVHEADRIALQPELPFEHGKRCAVINPNASDLRIERRWDGACFARLMEKMVQAFPEYHLLLIGVKSETEYTASILNQVSPKFRNHITDLSGRLSLGMLFALLERAELLISNDTGPMHAAFALKKKSITLWGPGHPRQYRDAASSTAIYKNVYCSPCIYEFDIPPCQGDNACMKAITVEEVFEAARRTLTDEIEPVAGPQGVIFTHQDGVSPLGVVIKEW